MAEKPRSVEKAEEQVDRLTEPDQPRKYATDPRPTSDRGELAAEQQRESAESWAGPGLPMMTDAQWKGFAFGSLVGGAIGVVLLVPLAFIPWPGLDLPWRLLVAAITGALAGGTAGALYLGGREPELEGETVDADNRPSAGTTMRDPHTDERGR